jgi:hypothetical protein
MTSRFERLRQVNIRIFPNLHLPPPKGSGVSVFKGIEIAHAPSQVAEVKKQGYSIVLATENGDPFYIAIVKDSGDAGSTMNLVLRAPRDVLPNIDEAPPFDVLKAIVDRFGIMTAGESADQITEVPLDLARYAAWFNSQA